MSVEMLKLSGSSIVADEIELSTLNSVVGMHSASGRWATYNTPMDGQRGPARITLSSRHAPGSPELNCCSVNSPRGFGMIADWAVMHDAQGIRLNYYGPSRFTLQLANDGPVEITQETDYPVSGDVSIAVSPQAPQEFTLRLRIPYWSRQTRAALNGVPIEPVKPGHYLAIHRQWHPGDRIDLSLDMSLHFWPGERECQGKTSIYHGPLLLTFDQRFNLPLAGLNPPGVRTPDPWKPSTGELHIPSWMPGN